MDQVQTIKTGGCLCGAIRYRAQGQPHHLNYCHCRQCRRHSGAPVAAFASYPASAVVFEQGAPSWFASSAIARRGFCIRCGTPMLWQANDRRDWYDIGVGTFDDASDFVMNDHVWTGRALPWLHIADDLPRYERGRRSPKLPG
jgi:hypothetical protein